MMSKLSNIIKNHNYQTLFLLFFSAFFLCIREPDVFTYSRLWTEEGVVFFHNAWVMPPLKALFYSYAGYLNFATNGATLVARWSVPLLYVPYVTTIIGLLFQLLPLFLLLTAKDEWLNSTRARIFATLLLLLVPDSLETSLQSLHIQFYLALSVCIIMILNTDKTYLRWIKLIILIVSALSGLMAFLLLPLYGLKMLIDRKWLRTEQFFTLFIGCIIQYSFFYEKVSTRSYHFHIQDFLGIFFSRDIIIPFFGYNHLTDLYLHQLQNQNVHNFLIVSCILCIITLGYILFCFYKYPPSRLSIFFLLSALILLATSIFGALGDLTWFYIGHVNQRYIFISQSLLCLMLLYFSYTLSNKGKVVCNVLIIWLIFVGFFNFFSMTYTNEHLTPWRTQVHLWQGKPDYVFQLWGGDGWKMTLPPNNN